VFLVCIFPILQSRRRSRTSTQRKILRPIDPRTPWLRNPYPIRQYINCLLTYLHGRRSRGDGGTSPPPEFGAGETVPQILSCWKILSTRLLALQCRKMCFCLYSRTFIVSPAMRPPQNSSQIYAYAYLLICSASFDSCSSVTRSRMFDR